MTSTLLDRFNPVPSWQTMATVEINSAPDAEERIDALGVPVATNGHAPAGPSLPDPALGDTGFKGALGQTLAVQAQGRLVLAYGTGDPETLDAAAVRDAAAAFARTASQRSHLSLRVPTGGTVGAEAAAQAAVEGVLLARYEYAPLRRQPAGVPVRRLTLVVDPANRDATERGARRGTAFAQATALARDLANSPPSLLTAGRFAEYAQALAKECDLDVEVYDETALSRLGCGGLLGVNAGSVDPPRMIKLRYEPPGAAGDVPRLTLVGKGIMYDSGGIALKPADAVHATMKNDMSGAGAIFAAMSVLHQLDCPVAVTGYLMCTDNMPSGSATKLGDVLSIRGGTTVEVVNTDAEGRLVMADALVLATEEVTDAIVDIATLTGSCMRALGTQIAGVFGNRQHLVDQVLAAGTTVGESLWQLPLAHEYRRELDSDVADMKNLGGPNAGAIHAALFLEEFVAGKAWAHVDIAGTAQNEKAAGWQTAGCSGFGARLLVELALGFTAPSA